MFTKLTTLTIADALKNMSIGQTAFAPDGCKWESIKKTCSTLKKEGYIFQTSTKTGELTITRLR